MRLSIDTFSMFHITVEKNNLALLVLPVLLGGRAKGKSGGRCALAQSLTSFIHLKPVNWI